MTILACSLALLARVCGADGGVESRQPQFTASPVPVRGANVAWKAGDALGRGIEAWAAGKRTKALRWFEVAVHRTPGDSMAWHNLGVALYTASRFEDAMTAFRWQRLLAPSAPSAWYGIGMCERVAGRLPDAENAFLLAVNGAPREWEYWWRLGEVLEAQGKVSAARAASHRAAVLRPRMTRHRPWRSRMHVTIMGVRVPRIPTTFPR